MREPPIPDLPAAIAGPLDVIARELRLLEALDSMIAASGTITYDEGTAELILELRARGTPAAMEQISRAHVDGHRLSSAVAGSIAEVRRAAALTADALRASESGAAALREVLERAIIHLDDRDVALGFQTALNQARTGEALLARQHAMAVEISKLRTFLEQRRVDLACAMLRDEKYLWNGAGPASGEALKDED